MEKQKDPIPVNREQRRRLAKANRVFKRKGFWAYYNEQMKSLLTKDKTKLEK